MCIPHLWILSISVNYSAQNINILVNISKGLNFFGMLQVLEKLSPKPMEVPQKVALHNPSKNRSDRYLPGRYFYVDTVAK